MKNFTFLLMLSLAAFSLSAQTNEIESNDDFATANPVVLQQTLVGQTCANPEQDYFLITLPSSGTLNIYTSISAGNVDSNALSFSLYSKSQTLIEVFYPAVGVSMPVADTLNQGCLAADTFYIKVASSSFFAYCYDYQFFYTVTPLTYPADAESNNDFTTAIPLATQFYGQGQLNIFSDPGYSPDEDFYQIIVPEDGTLRVFTSAEYSTTVSNTMMISLYSKDQEHFSDLDAAVGVFGNPLLDTLYWSCISADTMYLKLFTASTFDCGYSYQILYDVIPPAHGNDIEPNNTFDEANILPYAQSVGGHLGFDDDAQNSPDDDFYQIVLPSSGTLRLFTNVDFSSSGSNQLSVGLFTKDQINIAIQSADVGDFNLPVDDTLYWTCMGADTMYLKLFIDDPFDCGYSYEISFDVLTPAYSADAEPNDTFAEAALLSYNIGVQGQLGFDNYTVHFPDQDYYQMVIPDDGMLRLFTSADKSSIGSFGLNASLYSKDGLLVSEQFAELGDFNIPVADTLYWSCISGDTMYLKVSLNSGFDCGFSYSLRYDIIPPLFSNDQEPNDEFASAEVIDPDFPIEGHLNFYADSTSDYFKFFKPDNGFLNIYIESETADSTGDSLLVSLYDHNTNFITDLKVLTGTNQQAATDSITITSLAADTFYLKATWFGESCGSYRLTLRSTLITTVSDPVMESIMVYPNPSSGLVVIKSGLIPIEGIKVSDVLGKEIFSISNLPYQSSYSIRLSAPDGIYSLQLKTKEYIVERKIVIAH